MRHKEPNMKSVNYYFYDPDYKMIEWPQWQKSKMFVSFEK